MEEQIYIPSMVDVIKKSFELFLYCFKKLGVLFFILMSLILCLKVYLYPEVHKFFIVMSDFINTNQSNLDAQEIFDKIAPNVWKSLFALILVSVVLWLFMVAVVQQACYKYWNKSKVSLLELVSFGLGKVLTMSGLFALVFFVIMLLSGIFIGISVVILISLIVVIPVVLFEQGGFFNKIFTATKFSMKSFVKSILIFIIMVLVFIVPKQLVFSLTNFVDFEFNMSSIVMLFINVITVIYLSSLMFSYYKAVIVKE